MSGRTRRGLLVLFGGPAGAGKSTLAAAWCATRPRAVHIQLDHVREMIVSGRAEPQEGGALQSEQYELSVAACCSLARVFVEAGYDAAVDAVRADVLSPPAFEAHWQPQLKNLEWQAVIVVPSLEETLRRSRARGKRVLEEITRRQHKASLLWPKGQRIDTTGLNVEESLALVERVLDSG